MTPLDAAQRVHLAIQFSKKCRIYPLLAYHPMECPALHTVIRNRDLAPSISMRKKHVVHSYETLRLTENTIIQHVFKYHYRILWCTLREQSVHLRKVVWKDSEIAGRYRILHIEQVSGDILKVVNQLRSALCVLYLSIDKDDDADKKRHCRRTHKKLIYLVYL